MKFHLCMYVVNHNQFKSIYELNCTLTCKIYKALLKFNNDYISDDLFFDHLKSADNIFVKIIIKDLFIFEERAKIQSSLVNYVEYNFPYNHQLNNNISKIYMYLNYPNDTFSYILEVESLEEMYNIFNLIIITYQDTKIQLPTQYLKNTLTKSVAFITDGILKLMIEYIELLLTGMTKFAN